MVNDQMLRSDNLYREACVDSLQHKLQLGLQPVVVHNVRLLPCRLLLKRWPLTETALAPCSSRVS